MCEGIGDPLCRALVSEEYSNITWLKRLAVCLFTALEELTDSLCNVLSLSFCSRGKSGLVYTVGKLLLGLLGKSRNGHSGKLEGVLV